MRKKEIKKEGSIAATANTFENGVLKILKGMKTTFIPLSVIMCLFLTVMCTPRHPAEPEMVFVHGGTFRMGCTGDDCNSWEKPVHEVTLSSFSIGKYEVTQAQWEALMGSNPSEFKGGNLPVENVSWDDVQKFIERLNATTGKQYRLPTEAEWEYAARGGKKSRGYKYSGSNSIRDVAWMSTNSAITTNPVGTRKANELGIYDMSGNVWEWCNDRYGDYPASAQNNPVGALSGSYRVSRGGSWGNRAGSCRVANRNVNSPVDRDNFLGFRLACSSKQDTENREKESAGESKSQKKNNLVTIRLEATANNGANGISNVSNIKCNYGDKDHKILSGTAIEMKYGDNYFSSGQITVPGGKSWIYKDCNIIQEASNYYKPKALISKGKGLNGIIRIGVSSFTGITLHEGNVFRVFCSAVRSGRHIPDGSTVGVEFTFIEIEY